MRLPTRNLSSVMEAIERAQYAQTMIDGLWCGLGHMIELAADIVEQTGFVEPGERVPSRVQPARQMEQVIAVSAQGAQRELTNSLGIEKVVGPGNFPALRIEQPIGRCTGRGVLENKAKTHRDGASARRRAKSLWVAPAAKKLLGSWAAGKWTIRTVNPAWCKRWPKP
jgi:hypothetical protein